MKTQHRAIAITLATDEDGNFVSLSVYAANSVCLYTSYDLTSNNSKFWLSQITLTEGKKYYSL